VIRRSSTVSALIAVILLALGGSAQADTGDSWHIGSVSNTTVAPGGNLKFNIWLQNIVPTDGSEVKLKATLPPGLTGVSFENNAFGEMSCAAVAGETTIECSGTPPASSGPGFRGVSLIVAADPNSAGILTTTFDVEGGGPLPGHTADPVSVTATTPDFGFDAFDVAISDPAGGAYTQAAGHPETVTTFVDFNRRTNPSEVVGEVDPVEDVKDVKVELPPGFLGNPNILGTCSFSELTNGGLSPKPACPSSSQVGVAIPQLGFAELSTPLYNLEKPPGVPARFGFVVLGVVTVLDAHIRSGGDYGLTVISANTPQAIVVSGATIRFWGVPGGAQNDLSRSCPGEYPPQSGGPNCSSGVPPLPFFRTPTQCAPAPAISATINSWQDPGDVKSRTIHLHQPQGYPYSPDDPAPGMGWGPPVGFDGCEQVDFAPQVEATPTTTVADAPSGLDLHIRVPQDCWQDAAELCQSDLKDAAVKLPAGMVLNPAAATGRTGCSEAEFGYLAGSAGPYEFSSTPAACPEAAKIGTVEVQTPLLENPLKGSVYLAKQGDNPAGSLLALYLTAEAEGVVLKQVGEVSFGPGGTLTTRFTDAPQAPFSDFRVSLFGGPRAPLRTPSACGQYSVGAQLVPWSNPASSVNVESAFAIDSCSNGGFDPKLRAGTQNPLAGTGSPFVLQLTRQDGTQELGRLQVTLPPGLVGSLKGYSYCPDAVLAAISGAPGSGGGEERTPSCPASSRVGSVTVGAGAGPNPFYTSSGRAYLAGPYKGAPLSLAVVAPAVAGPFDLGSVLVRNAIRVHPETAQLTIDSDPLPAILHGIPLDLRDVRVRYDYTLNPTSCEPMQVSSTITSTQGATASPSVPFQAAACDRLGFKPRLSLRLSGPSHRAAHPALRAVLRARPGDANIGNATVLLPKTELIENAHIRTICTRVQFNAAGGGGAGCPKGSAYGYAKAWSPILAEPLQGPVYLRSNGGARELPDLVAALDGQIHVDVVGYIDSVNERIRNRFALVPDAPVSKFVLNMQGGKKGLLANNTNICRAKPRATVHFGAHNGKVQDSRPRVKVRCGGKGKRKR
jgi:uncharacterized repeat protein (TIGR01451 family)